MKNIDQKAVGSLEWESTNGLPIDDVMFKRIKDLYVKQLIIPDQMPKHQFFLCPIGLVGAGKTTVTKPLAERLHLVRISTDEIRKLLKEQGCNHVKTAEVAYSIISDFAEKGYSIAVDADCAGNNVAEAITQAAKAIGAKIAWIHIKPPEDFILQKLRNFKHTWLFKDADEAIANYYRRKPLHENLDYPFLYTFDTSHPDLPRQLENAINIIEAFSKDESSSIAH
ncbi:MAG: AAA family ATPase [Patescibacteria group bacterium]|jgi:predicted kinase